MNSSPVSVIGQFPRGFFYPFRALRFLLRQPRLLRFVAIPFLINLVVFVGTVYWGLDFFGETVVTYLPQGEAWYWSLLYYLAWVLAVLVTAVLVFFSFTVIGNLIASPFNDLLSERTEALLTGVKEQGRFSLGAFGRDALRTVATEGKKLSLFVVLMLLLLPLNLLPGAGSLAYSVLALLVTVFFLVVEYLGFVFSRKGMGFAAQRRYIMARKPLMFGFGLGVLALLAIPFLQFFCIPVAVVAATQLWCDSPAPPVPGSEGGRE